MTSLRWQGQFVSKSKCCHQVYVRIVENRHWFKGGLHFPTQKYAMFFKLISALFLPQERTSVFSGYKLKWKEIAVTDF